MRPVASVLRVSLLIGVSWGSFASHSCSFSPSSGTAQERIASRTYSKKAEAGFAFGDPASLSHLPGRLCAPSHLGRVAKVSLLLSCPQ
ncbi:MAG: hypothetical protein IJU76_12200 [Desulfovibrionaceae bacterium]|nr:hypothetical protein [Desulfovibrionaceae bacterium]